jgi:AcrR family transcriptional regulator
MKQPASASTMSGARSRSAASRRDRSERTELALLRTATLLFSERGFHGTSIRDIADAAELAVSAMYYYASSKDELLNAIMHRGLSKLISGSDLALAGVTGASERLAILVAFHVIFHAVNPRTSGRLGSSIRSSAPWRVTPAVTSWPCGTAMSRGGPRSLLTASRPVSSRITAGSRGWLCSRCALGSPTGSALTGS